MPSEVSSKITRRISNVERDCSLCEQGLARVIGKGTAFFGSVESLKYAVWREVRAKRLLGIG
jgi:hypothetical protein